MMAALTQDTSNISDKNRKLHRAVWASTLTIMLSFGGVGGWLYVARLDSAAVARGILENAVSTKTVQHLEGGIVSEISVRNGAVVAAGDLLVRLDKTRSAASADLFKTQLWSSRVRRVRLEIQLRLGQEIVFPKEIKTAAATDKKVARVLVDEAETFTIAQNALRQNISLFETLIQQTRVEADGHALRKQIAQNELEFVAEDLKNTQSLRDRGLTNQTAVTALNIDRLALEEKIALADIQVAQIEQQILGFQLQIAQTEEEYRQIAAEKLEVVNREINNLERDIILASDSLNRVEVRAPVAGTVQESILGTVGAVVRSGETIMKIVPLTTDFVIVAQVSPDDIENLVPGSGAQITFPAFGGVEGRPAEGTLETLSRDRIVDERADLEYYEAKISMDESTITEEVRSRLVAGMSASVILPTGERTALEYILSPLLDPLRAAMRED